MIHAALTSLCLVALLLATAISARAQAVDDPAKNAIDESIRRQEMTLRVREKLAAAQAAQKRNEITEAVKKYEEAWLLIEKIGVAGVEPEQKLVSAGLILTHLQLADQAMRRTEYGEAANHIARVVKVDPRNADGLAMKLTNDRLRLESAGRRPTDEMIALIPGVIADRLKTGEYVQNGKFLLEMGRLEAAEVELKKAIARDPSDKTAFYYMDLVQGNMYAEEARKRERSSKEMLMLVEKEWQIPITRDLLDVPNPYARTNLVHTSPERQAIFLKLRRIKLSSLQIDSLPLSEVIKALAEDVKRSDPEGLGVNFLISPNIETPAAAAGAPAVDPAGVPIPPPAPIDVGAITIKIGSPMGGLTVEHALDIITKVAESPIKYSVEDWGIVLSPKANVGVPLHVRIFKLDPNTFYQGLQNVTEGFFGSGGGGGGGGGNNNGNNGFNNNNGGFNNNNGGFNNNNGGFNNNNGGFNNNNGGFNNNNGGFNNGNNGNNGGGRGGGGGGGMGSSFAQVSITGGGGQGGQQGGGQGQGQGGTNGAGAGGGGIEFVTTVTKLAPKIAIVREFFSAAGVDLEAPKTVFFNDRTGVLMVRATMADLDMVEKAIQVMNIAPPQLTIKSRIMEITQEDNRALGFDWYLGNTLMRNGGIGAQAGTAPSYVSPGGIDPRPSNPSGVFPGPGSAPGLGGPGAVPPSVSDNLLTGGLRQSAPALATVTGILTDPQFRFVVRALEQRGGVDLLSCPEITTLSARQAQIKVVDVKYVVTDLSINQLGVPGGNGGIGGVGGGGGGGAVSSTIQPITEPVEIGPVLDVIPYVMADGYTIQMSIIPTLKEFLGYDSQAEFQSVVQSVGGANAAAPLISPTPLPKYRLRQIAVDCIVWDGQTIMLGGLISEDVQKTKDKIPVLGDLPLLGRFFRSESNTSKKKNLVYFVTPTIIDPAGNRLHSAEEMPFAQHTIPAQKTVIP